MNVSASCCSIKRLEGGFVTAILFIGCSGRSCLKSHDTERLHSNHPLPVVLPRRPRNKSRTSQAAMTCVRAILKDLPCLVAERWWRFGPCGPEMGPTIRQCVKRPDHTFEISI